MRLDKLRLPPAGFAVVIARRPRPRAGAAAFFAVAGVLAEAIFAGRMFLP